MAALVQAAVGPPISCRVEASPSTTSRGESSLTLHRSQFLGSRPIRVSSAIVQQKKMQSRTELKAIRSASIFEKLGQLFSSNPADEEQVFSVYEINQNDRSSPQYLRLTTIKDSPNPALGDLVPYSNKVYGPSGKDYLGLSAGLCTVIEHNPSGGDRYETTYTHYLGGYGQLSAMGPYYTYADSEMVVTGGTGIFKGARGTVKIHNVRPPIQLLYTYNITGIQKLPIELTSAVVPLPTPASSNSNTSPPVKV